MDQSFQTAIKQQVLQKLDELEIDYQELQHEAITTVAEGKLIAQAQGAFCCKTLLLKSKKNFYLLMLPADKRLTSKNVSKFLNCGHLSFATAEELKEKLSTFPGAVSVLGLMFNAQKDVQVLIDFEVLEHTHIDCHPCINNSSLKIATHDITHKWLPFLGFNWIVIHLESA